MNNIFSQLSHHAEQLKRQTLNQLFVEDPKRVEKWQWQVAGIRVDLSKNHIDDAGRILWFSWLKQQQTSAHIKAMLSGEKVNYSEHRPALHHALRARAEGSFIVDGTDIYAEIRKTRAQIRDLTAAIRQGTLRGFSGKAIEDVVHIGIGGSELGPRLLCESFAHRSDRVRIHFLASPDPIHIQSLQQRLNPETTLLIIASKTFTTEETLANAHFMRHWLHAAGGQKADEQMIALTAAIDKAHEFGISSAHILPFWDWVGGRFSLWSAIALPFALQNGYDAYEQLLSGAHEMDQHFQSTPEERNLPMHLALIDAWYNHYFAIDNRAIVTYAQPLNSFVPYLQQLEMESLGKRANQQGTALIKPSGMIIWGGSGTESQHAFFQLIHQGQRRIPLDFITVKSVPNGYEAAGTIVHGNCLAQAEALMRGRTLEDLKDLPLEERYQRTCAGNHPSNMVILDELTPFHLGALIALYEHKTTVLGTLYDVNAFDQWGVELGKVLAKKTEASLRGECTVDNPSTRALIDYLRQK